MAGFFDRVYSEVLTGEVREGSDWSEFYSNWSVLRDAAVQKFAATQSAWALSQQRETRVKSDAAKDDDNYMLSIPTYQQLRKGKTAKINTAQWTSGGIMVLAALPIAFMSALYGERLVRDRVGGMRVHLFVSSLRRVQYYAGNFIVDFMFVHALFTSV